MEARMSKVKDFYLETAFPVYDDYMEDIYKSMDRDIETLKKENLLLREAIGFYASPGSWTVDEIVGEDLELLPAHHAGTYPCGGKRARTILKNLEKKEKSNG